MGHTIFKSKGPSKHTQGEEKSMVVCLLGLERHNLLTCWIKVPRLSSKVPVALPSSLLRMGEVEFSSLWNEKKKKKNNFVSKLKYKPELSTENKQVN